MDKKVFAILVLAVVATTALSGCCCWTTPDYDTYNDADYESHADFEYEHIQSDLQNIETDIQIAS